jgi:hypothetical protein
MLVCGAAPGLAGEGATLDPSPNPAAVGDTVTITGSDWTIDVDLFVAPDRTCDQGRVATGTVVDGQFRATFTVDQAVGTYRLSGCEGGKFQLSVPFDVVAQPKPPGLSATPKSGVADRQVHVTGANWVPSLGDVTLLFGRSHRRLTSVSVLEDGTFATSFDLDPRLSSGNYQLTACQECDAAEAHPQQSITLVVTSPSEQKRPVLVFSPSTGVVGDRVTVSGVNWNASAGVVRLFLHGEQSRDLSRQWISFPVLAGGRFRQVVTLPPADARTYSIVACQRCRSTTRRISTTADVTVVDSAQVDPAITPSPGEGRAGATVRVLGSGWRADGNPVFIFATAEDSTDPSRAIGKAVPTVDGAFSTQLKVPDREAGTYVFVACQHCAAATGRLQARVAFRILVTPGAPKGLVVLGVALAACAVGFGGGLVTNGLRNRRKQRAATSAETPRLELRPDPTGLVTSRSPDGHVALSLRLVPHQRLAPDEITMEELR